MTTVETGYAHIFLDERQVPVIDDTNMKVIELVTPHLAYGWSPEELAYNYPHLTLGQIHSALAYYWDHQAELDADMARRLAYVDELRRNTPEPPFVARLRSRGLLRQYNMK
jgi:uncharacterized protein (DUF433 family)